MRNLSATRKGPASAITRFAQNATGALGLVVPGMLLCLSRLCLGGELSLDGEWRLDYFPQPISGAVRELPLKVPFKTVKASVPGNCELDLVNAGVLPPLEIGLNVIDVRKYEGHQWLYTKSFNAPEMTNGCTRNRSMRRR